MACLRQPGSSGIDPVDMRRAKLSGRCKSQRRRRGFDRALAGMAHRQRALCSSRLHRVHRLRHSSPSITSCARCGGLLAHYQLSPSASSRLRHATCRSRPKRSDWSFSASGRTFFVRLYPVFIGTVTCAVTGVAEPRLLRASHIKPWAKCDTDAERLDVFDRVFFWPLISMRHSTWGSFLSTTRAR